MDTPDFTTQQKQMMNEAQYFEQFKGDGDNILFTVERDGITRHIVSEYDVNENTQEIVYYCSPADRDICKTFTFTETDGIEYLLDVTRDWDNKELKKITNLTRNGWKAERGATTAHGYSPWVVRLTREAGND